MNPNKVGTQERGSDLLTRQSSNRDPWLFSSPSERARRDMESLPGEPFWFCDWTEVIFVHFEVNAAILQREVPFRLDLFDGRAFVSLVAFKLTDMRPRRGGRLTRLLFSPFGTHRFLNARAYVRHGDQRGIYFLAEWLDAPWLNLLAGPQLYGLPFRAGQLNYDNRATDGTVRGDVRDRQGALAYSGGFNGPVRPAVPGSLDEFLVERYRAFTCRNGRRGCFPVWHEPWHIAPMSAAITDRSLLGTLESGLAEARLYSGHWSPGAGGVWMGWRQRQFKAPSQTSPIDPALSRYSRGWSRS